jgi:hypothetical protein
MLGLTESKEMQGEISKIWKRNVCRLCDKWLRMCASSPNLKDVNIMPWFTNISNLRFITIEQAADIDL